MSLSSPAPSVARFLPLSQAPTADSDHGHPDVDGDGNNVVRAAAGTLEDHQHNHHHHQHTNLHPFTPPASILTSPSTHSLSAVQSSSSLTLVRVQANVMVMDDAATEHVQMSRFEEIISTCEPVLNSLLANLPTKSIFSLRGTSKFLKQFLHDYPLAFKTLSFRLPQQPPLMGSAGNETPDGNDTPQLTLDLKLQKVVMPVATLLTNLDLDNTSVYGATLVAILQSSAKLKVTLKHLSVRGCKNVSLKYHIVPFLKTFDMEKKMYPKDAFLALESLYTYRCRHHRRRPYLPISLTRRDSDSEPTHDLIKLCHVLGIWTDTAWCPTPGPRCLRRKDYHGNRGGPGHNEVWVPFDRLWRSGNRVGPNNEERGKPVGKLWEEIECGHDGEPLGLGDGTFPGEGKDVPVHKRLSHRTFVDDVKCDECGDAIPERCETCSIKMHCMGCRKTLCANCAFNRPYNAKRNIVMPSSNSPAVEPKEPEEDLWWAGQGVTTSPNQMIDSLDLEDADNPNANPQGGINAGQFQQPLKLTLQWCCLEPLFSGGGGVVFVGPGLQGTGSERIRAVPLPRQKEYIDSDFASTISSDDETDDPFAQNVKKFENLTGSTIDILPYLQQSTSDMELQSVTCPRSLCKPCYEKTFAWRVSCRACKRPICKEHDFRALKVRKCGYRELSEERDYVLNPPEDAREVMRRNDMVAAAQAAQAERIASDDNVEVDGEGKEWPRGLVIPAFRRPRAIRGDDAESASIESSSTAAQPGPSSEEDRRSRGRSVRGSDELGSDADSSADGPGTRDPSNAPAASLRIAQLIGGERAASVAPGSSTNGPEYQADDEYSIVSGYQNDHADEGTNEGNGETAWYNAGPATPRAINTNGAVVPGSNAFAVGTSLPRRSRSVSMSDILGGTSPSSSRSPLAHNLNTQNLNTLKGKHKYQLAANAAAPQATSVTMPKERLLLPGNGRHPVQWKGCGAYFCQSVRPMGDNRGRCSSGGKECNECGVFVCEACLPQAKNCPCNFCAQTFHCEYCLTKKSVRQSCQREADRQREKKRQKEIKETQERLAAMGGGFWELLVGSGYVDEVIQEADEQEERDETVILPSQGLEFSLVVREPTVPESGSGDHEAAADEGSGSGSDTENNSTGAGAMRDQVSTTTDDDASDTVVGDDVVGERERALESGEDATTPADALAALIANGGVDQTQNQQHHQGPNTIEEWGEVWQRAAEN